MDAYYIVIKRVNIYKLYLIADDAWKKADQLCRDLDITDLPHAALTLHLNGLLWTGDKKLKAGLQAKGFDRFFEP